MLDEVQKAFLSEHHLAVLATGRGDGSPQISTVMYDYDGCDIVMSVKSYTAKWKNVLRQPQVGLLVGEGRRQLIVYGRVEPIADDPLRAELTRRVFRRVSGQEPPSADALKPTLNEQQRTVLRLVPERSFMNE